MAPKRVRFADRSLDTLCCPTTRRERRECFSLGAVKNGMRLVVLASHVAARKMLRNDAHGRNRAANVRRPRSSISAPAMSTHDIVGSQIGNGRSMMILDHPVVPLLGRLMMAYIFATSGIGKIFGWSGNVAYMNTRHLPMIPLLLAAALVIEVAGSVCVVTGYQARMAALVMFWYTTAVTVLFHNYWAASEAMAGMQETHFRKNLGIMGGLLMLAYRWTRKMGVGAASRFLTGSGLHFGCPGLTCLPN